MLTERQVLRRVAFVGTGRSPVYASLYAPGPIAGSGVVICPPWGADAALAVDPSHRIAAALAGRGIGCVLYHPPGHLDSGGDPADVSLDDLAEAAVGAAGLLREHCAVDALDLVGIGLGASAAALAARRANARSVVVVEPALDPAAYFAGLRRSGTRASLGRGEAGAPFGHAVPHDEVPADAAVRVREALERMTGRAVTFRFDSSAPDDASPVVDEIVVPGNRTVRRWPNRFVEPLVSFLAEAS